MTSRLKNAEERLEKAVERIDAALARSTDKQRSESRLADLESENSALRRQNEEIAGRLDGAIARLQRILQAP